MARLVHEDSLIGNRAERAVVKALVGVSDPWFIVPNLYLIDRKQPRESDVVRPKSEKTAIGKSQVAS